MASAADVQKGVNLCLELTAGNWSHSIRTHARTQGSATIRGSQRNLNSEANSLSVYYSSQQQKNMKPWRGLLSVSETCYDFHMCPA